MMLCRDSYIYEDINEVVYRLSAIRGHYNWDKPANNRH